MKIIINLLIIIVGGFIGGIIYAYIHFGLTGQGWSLRELGRDIRRVIEYDIIDLPWRFFAWIRNNA